MTQGQGHRWNCHGKAKCERRPVVATAGSCGWKPVRKGMDTSPEMGDAAAAAEATCPSHRAGGVAGTSAKGPAAALQKQDVMCTRDLVLTGWPQMPGGRSCLGRRADDAPDWWRWTTTPGAGGHKCHSQRHTRLHQFLPTAANTSYSSIWDSSTFAAPSVSPSLK